MFEIAIIGGGLSGLSLAHRLQRAGRSFLLCESRDRLGGRILSVAGSRRETGGDGAGFRYDLGPGWVWPAQQPRIAALLRQFNLESYPQWIAGRALYQPGREIAPQAYVDQQTYADARRIAGGSERLIEALVGELPAQRLMTGSHLRQLTDRGDHIELELIRAGEVQRLRARQVVLALPPRLLAQQLGFEPALDARLLQMMQQTPTWMAGHAKALIRYRHPFWREAGWSGAVLANYRGAILGEVFDAGAEDGSAAALSGFFALPTELRRQYRGDLYALILDQLVGLFGPEAAAPEELMIKEWADEPLTATADDAIPPTDHPQYGHRWFELDHWNDKLHFAGTETAPGFGGYLEGALESAERAAQALGVWDEWGGALPRCSNGGD